MIYSTKEILRPIVDGKELSIDSCNVCPFCRPSDNACLKREPAEARKLVYPIPVWCVLRASPQGSDDWKLKP